MKYESGEKIKAARKARGISQVKLSEITGINLGFLRNLEHGEKNLNTSKMLTVYRLCNAMGCSLYDLLTDKDLIEEIEKYEEKNKKHV